MSRIKLQASVKAVDPCLLKQNLADHMRSEAVAYSNASVTFMPSKSESVPNGNVGLLCLMGRLVTH